LKQKPSCLLDLFREIAPERSLLLSFAAPPAVVETLLLRHLQTHGQGEVTILVDSDAYQDALIEAESAQWAGVHYDYYPVHLPRPSGVFHPKFSLLFGRETAHLLVSSANLSPSSLHENAEVLDHLELNEDGPGDAGAFLDAADFLQAMLELPDAAIPTGARRRLAWFISELERRILRARGDDSGARLLHSLRAPLLPQVTRYIASEAVHEITAVSPFFDPAARALRELANEYPLAHLRVVHRGADDTDLHHRHLRSLRGRISVEAFEHADGLRLHAKTLRFKGSEGVHIITGSANLTAAAWCEHPGTGGNVEVVVLRHALDPAAYDVFGEHIDTTPNPLESLQGRAEYPEPERDDTYASILTVVDAVEEKGAMRLRIRAGVDWTNATIRVHVHAAGWAAEPPVAVTWGNGFADVFAESLEGVDDVEGAIVVRLELISPGGVVGRAVAWLHRPERSAVPARERRWRRMLARLEQSGWDDEPDDYEILVDFCHSTLEMLQRRNQKLSSDIVADNARAGGIPRRSTDEALDDRARHRLRERVAEAMYRAMAGDASGGSRAASERVRGGQSSSESRPAADRERNTRTDAWLVRLVPAIFAFPVDRYSVDEVLLQMDMILRVLLRRYEARLADPKGKPEELLVHLTRMLNYAFSVKGTERGQPSGWMARAWMDRELRDELVGGLRVPERRAVLLFALSLASQPRGSNVRKNSPVPGLRNVLAGLCLAIGDSRPWADQQTRAHLDQLTESIASLTTSHQLVDVERTLDELAEAPVPVLRTVRRFLPLLRGTAGEPIAGDGALERQVRRFRARKRTAISTVVNPDRDPACGACHQRLPLTCWDAVRSAADDAICPSCGIVLTPFSAIDPALTELLSALEAMCPVT
jgi:hypothetical protein